MPSDTNLSPIKKTATPLLIALRNQLAHGELTGVVIGGLARNLSVNMASAIECPLRCGHCRNRLPPFDLHVHPGVILAFEILIRGKVVLRFVL